MIDFIGWTLVHAAWQGGLIAAAVAALLWLTRRGNASTRYVIALAGLALTVAAPITTTLAYNPPVRAEEFAKALQIAASSSLPEHRASVSSSIDERNVARRDPSGSQRVGDGIVNALPWLVTIWLFGVGVLSIRVLAGIANVRSLGHRGVSTVDARIRSVTERVAARLGIRSAVRVLQSTQVDVPMVIGWLKPVVLVPVSLVTGAAPVQLEMLLAHELAHVRRYDTIVNLMQTIVETLLFYHPGIWWISARVRDERENCCDDLAIAASGNDRLAYGALLLLLEESRTASALAVAATDGSLLRRVQRIVLGSSRRVDLGASWVAGVVTMLTVLFVVVPTGTPAIAARAAESAITPPPLATPVNPPVAARMHRQEPLTAAPTQPTSRNTTMTRSSILAGAAALTVAAATLPAQTPPNFSGRWIEIGSTADSVEETLTIDQTNRALTFTQSPDPDVKLSFRIEETDASSVRIKGPFAVTAGNMEFAVDDTTANGNRRVTFRAQWKEGGLEIHSTTTKIEMNAGTMRLSFDRGNLVIEIDITIGDEPPKRTVQRFRRA